MNKPYAPSLVQHAERLRFDEWDDAIMHDVVATKRLIKPIQELLITLSQIETTEGSFGADRQKVFEEVVGELKALRQACAEEWSEQ